MPAKLPTIARFTSANSLPGLSRSAPREEIGQRGVRHFRTLGGVHDPRYCAPGKAPDAVGVSFPQTEQPAHRAAETRFTTVNAV